MSAWSDLRAGAITDAEHRQEIAYQAGRDAYEEERMMDEAFFADLEEDLDMEEWA